MFYPTEAILQRKNREVVKPQSPSRIIITLQCVLKLAITVLYHIYQSRSKHGIEAS